MLSLFMKFCWSSMKTLEICIFSFVEFSSDYTCQMFIFDKVPWKLFIHVLILPMLQPSVRKQHNAGYKHKVKCTFLILSGQYNTGCIDIYICSFFPLILMSGKREGLLPAVWGTTNPKSNWSKDQRTSWASCSISAGWHSFKSTPIGPEATLSSLANTRNSNGRKPTNSRKSTANAGDQTSCFASTTTGSWCTRWISLWHSFLDLSAAF